MLHGHVTRNCTDMSQKITCTDMVARTSRTCHGHFTMPVFKLCVSDRVGFILSLLQPGAVGMSERKSVFHPLLHEIENPRDPKDDTRLFAVNDCANKERSKRLARRHSEQS